MADGVEKTRWKSAAKDDSVLRGISAGNSAMMGRQKGDQSQFIFRGAGTSAPSAAADQCDGHVRAGGPHRHNRTLEGKAEPPF